MYLKCYYNPKGKIASVQEVESALPKDIACLTVDASMGYCAVNFPDKAPYEQWKRVQKVLQDAGFETE